ncbi:TSUP family transporter [Psychromarinibacter sp. C21-152]|uniref:Probable membrane transporter protein n=1 Tax=Psychromarinibacter sediminicola TaxID=3033385 RepID=A0AAE3NYG5_9RHOB|nr:TSUP family transporter [Psychromarinibacter sediminicola]MDF0602972.1 TSUP family transporter [Psychromarinibacter sediminicola]
MTDVLALGWGVWVYCAAAVFAGTLLQRLAGQGFGMVAAPLIALVAPEFLPATLLLIGAVVGFGATAVDRSAVARHELPAGFAGRALGAVLAVGIAVALPDAEALAAVVALVVYLGIALSVMGVRVAIRPVSLFSAGVVAGIMGTLTAVGAPPMALLYQHEAQKRSAAMQNTFFAWGMVVSIAALAVAGLVGWRHVVLAASLVPAAVLALWLAQPLAARVARARIRPYALGLAGTAATVLLAKTLI